MSKAAERKRKEKFKEWALLVKAAMDDGKQTRRAICKATKLKGYQLADLFKYNEELYALYKIRKKTLADTAADNIAEILEDPDHPSHFAASKYIHQTYKSEIDGILESKNTDEIEVDVPSDSKGGPVVIRFGKKANIEEE